eukprot:4017839-Alexandrium_andersonii.AAC.1
MDEALFSSYLDLHGKNKVWAGTISGGDLLFIPAGYTVYDKTHGEACTGLKASVLSEGPAAAEPLWAIFKELESKGTGSTT